MKRGIILSDLHCGSDVGLTPPWAQYQSKDVKKQDKFSEIQRQLWKWYTSTLKKIGKVDYLFLMGDCIEGQQLKSGGDSLITTSVEKQAAMAVDCIAEIKFKEKPEMVLGTPHHVTTLGMEAEQWIASEIGGNIGIQSWVSVNGFTFNLKHKTNRSIIPHGRMTGPARQMLWSVLWKEIRGFPGADLLIRGHVHYYQYYCSSMGAMMTCPCMKALGDRWGGSNFDDLIDYGFILFQITDDGEFSHQWYTPRIEREIPKVRAI